MSDPLKIPGVLHWQMLATSLLHLVGGDPSLTEPLRSDSASVELLLRFEVRFRGANWPDGRPAVA